MAYLMCLDCHKISPPRTDRCPGCGSQRFTLAILDNTEKDVEESDNNEKRS